MDLLFFIFSNWDLVIGSLFLVMFDDEVDNFLELEFFQVIVDNFERLQFLCLLFLFIFFFNEEVNFDWFRFLEDFLRMFLVKLVVGKKCQEIIVQEEVEVMVKVMVVFFLDFGFFRMLSLDLGDEMVIIFIQLEVCQF